METSVEFKVHVGTELVELYGKTKIEKLIQDYLNLAILKLSKQEMIDELETIDIKNKDWQETKEKAWTEYGSKYLFKVTG
ncbi:MAG: hypothetical protein ACK5UE_07300 [Chitinophagales bacterium]|jgi:hypothetical protein|nr:hypothetical protein [Sphingobacteriales bacterium]